MSGKVLGPGGDHISGLNWDNGAVGVGDKSSEASVHGDNAVVVGVRVAGSVGVGGDGSMVDGTAGGSVGNLSSVHLGGVSGHDGTVGVSHKLGGGESHAGRENLREDIVMPTYEKIFQREPDETSDLEQNY